MVRKANAKWQGNLKEGKGTLGTQSGVLNNISYNYKTRFVEGEKGTNPEELLAAAHAACFTMWVASLIENKGIKADSLETEANLTLEGLDIKKVHLTITGSVKGINENDFKSIVKEAERNCIISKALSIPISSEAHFVGEYAHETK